MEAYTAETRRTKFNRLKSDEMAVVPVRVLPGSIGLFHGPKKGGFPFSFEKKGIKLVVTLLNNSAEERTAHLVRDQAEREEIPWLWLHLKGAALPLKEDFPRILEAMEKMKETLETGGGVFIHCSAGLHRTGLIGNCLLRFIGLDRAAALEVIAASREKTARLVGDHRLEWAESFLSFVESHKTNQAAM